MPKKKIFLILGLIVLFTALIFAAFYDKLN